MKPPAFPVAVLMAALVVGPLPAASAEPLSSQDLLALGRADHWAQQGRWDAAATELGRLPHASQENPAVKRYVARTFGRLYGPSDRAPAGVAASPAPPSARGPRIVTQARIAHRRYDPEQRSDRSLDDLGWQYNTSGLLEADDAAGWRHVVRASVDGIQNDINDLRPRHLSYQTRRDGVRVTTGDIRTYLTSHHTSGITDYEYTGYTLNSVRVRGLDMMLANDRHDLHLVGGVTPYYLSPSDEYIYPRQIYGIRESYRPTAWYRAALGAAYARDFDERIEHVDPAIQPREFSVIAMEQDLTVIPDRWTVNAESAYSVTDDNLQPNRFGDNVKLRGWAHHVRSEWRWAPLRIIGHYERVGPEFRAPANVGANGVNSTTVPPDREHYLLRLYPRRMGPLFGQVVYGGSRNNLDDDASVEMTREEWLTAQGGLALPEPWPQPDARLTLTRTVSVPGASHRFSPDKRWLYNLDTSLRKRWWEIDWTGGYGYWEMTPDDGYDREYRRTFSLQAGRRLWWPGLYGSSRLAWTRAHDLFNNATMRRRTEREANVTLSSRLWSTSSLSVGYTYQDLGVGLLVDPDLQTARGGILHTFSSSFVWPYAKRLRWGRALELFPSLHFHYTDASDDQQRHPALASRFTARYRVRDAYRWELAFEHRMDDDDEIASVSVEEWRVWLALTSKFGPRLADETPFR